MPDRRSRPAGIDRRTLDAARPDQLPLAVGVEVAHRQPQQEAVELRLGQRIGAMELARVLRCQHDEGIGQGTGDAIDGDAALRHRLEQRRLGARRGAVDLVGQEHVAKHRPRLELELAGGRVEHRHADDVRRQQVAGELDALPTQAEHVGKGAGQRGLADAGHILEQDVAAGEHGGQHLLDDLTFADKNAGDGVDDLPTGDLGRTKSAHGWAPVGLAQRATADLIGAASAAPICSTCA